MWGLTALWFYSRYGRAYQRDGIGVCVCVCHGRSNCAAPRKKESAHAKSQQQQQETTKTSNKDHDSRFAEAMVPTAMMRPTLAQASQPRSRSDMETTPKP